MWEVTECIDGKAILQVVCRSEELADQLVDNLIKCAAEYDADNFNRYYWETRKHTIH